MKIRLLLWMVAALLVAQNASAQTPAPEITPEPTPEPTPEGDAGTPETVGGPPNVHGFITARYLVDDGKGRPYQSENGYDVQFARVNIDGKAHPLVRYLISVELADLNYGLAFREAYVIWAPKPRTEWLKKLTPDLRMGRLRRPGGIETFQDESELLTVDRSIVSGFMGNDDEEAPGQDFRDFGVRAGGTAGPIEGMAMGLTNGTRGPSPSPDDQQKDVMGRLGVRFGSPDGRFFIRTGVSQSGGRQQSHLYGDDPNPGSVFEYQNTAADLTVIAGPLHLQTEAVYGKRTLIDPATGNGFDTATGGAAYVLVAYRVKGKTAPYFRFGYRELSMNGNDDDFQRPKDWNNDITIGVNVQIVKKALTARAQYSLRSGFIPPQPAVGPLGASHESLNGLASASIQAEF